MKIIKPLRLGLLNKPYRWEGGNRLGISILALASMGENQQLRPEPELWDICKKEMIASDGIIDLAYPKFYPEFLATGFAYTAHQNQKSACEVSVAVGALEKKIRVSGERHWLGDAYASAQPFDALRLDWSTAYGGPECAENPHGMGAPTAGQPAPKQAHLDPVDHHGSVQTGIPTSFGPLGLQWPCRLKLAGENYDSQWFDTHFPGFPQDFDPRFFNMAEPGQIWPDQNHIEAGTPYAICNMHPHQKIQAGELPRWLARCFIHRASSPEAPLEEITMRHTTVWFFPHLDQMILIYHGSIPVATDDAHDVRSLMPALESMAEPRTIEHYHKVWLQREDPEHRARYAFQEADLLPQQAIGPWLDTDNSPEDSPRQNRMLARKQRLDEKYIPPLGAAARDRSPSAISQPSLAELPDFLTKLEAQAAEATQKARAQARAHGFNVDDASQPEARPKGPQSMLELRAQLQRQAEKNPSSMPPAKQASQEKALHQMYLHAVESQAKPSPLTAQQAATVRQTVVANLAHQRNLDGMDLTGADLSGLDLSRTSLRHTLLEGANLEHCNFEEADLTEAVLARTELSHASLRQACLDHASLFQANCTGADFSKASLHATRLQEALFEKCSFIASKIENTTLGKTFFIDCQFDFAKISQVNFHEVLLRQCHFQESWLHKVIFSNSTLEKLNFPEAKIKNSSWVQCKVDANFPRSEIKNTSFTIQTILEHADFKEARLLLCNFRGTPLQSASFVRATLHACDFSEAQLKNADFSEVDASDSIFQRADLTQAQFVHAKLISTSFQKAILYSCNFSHANLFRADISQAAIDQKTEWGNAYTIQMKSRPLRPKESA